MILVDLLPEAGFGASQPPVRGDVECWADVFLNPFQLEIELQSGSIENFTATTNSGCVGSCAPPGDPIVRLEMVGHDGIATKILHADPSVVGDESSSGGALKAQYLVSIRARAG